ncbi:MAG: hypothetical protein ACREEJ_23875, partial [Ensifer adhaerens]
VGAISYPDTTVYLNTTRRRRLPSATLPAAITNQQPQPMGCGGATEACVRKKNAILCDAAWCQRAACGSLKASVLLYEALPMTAVGPNRPFRKNEKRVVVIPHARL